LNEQEFLERYSEFRHLFNIVEEPANSRAKLLEYENKYGVSSNRVIWYYKVQGFDLSELIPDIDDWVYYFERFMRYGVDPNEFQSDELCVQANEGEETSGSRRESLVLFFNRLVSN
jgi:hypothetical protein